MAKTKKTENVEIIDEIIEEDDVVEETKVEKKDSKLKTAWNKYGKTALKVLGVGAVGVAAFALGKRVGESYDEDFDEFIAIEDSDSEGVIEEVNFE